MLTGTFPVELIYAAGLIIHSSFISNSEINVLDSASQLSLIEFSVYQLTLVSLLLGFPNTNSHLHLGTC